MQWSVRLKYDIMRLDRRFHCLHLGPNFLLGCNWPPVLPHRDRLPVNGRLRLADHPGRLHGPGQDLVSGIERFIYRRLLLPWAVMFAIVPVWSVLVPEQ